MAERLEVLSLRFGTAVDPDVMHPLTQSQSQSWMIRAILDSVSTGHVLHTLRIQFDHVRYYTDRAGLLATVCGAHVVEGIHRLTSYRKLRQLAFTFRENDPQYNESWWREQILLRLADDSQGPDFSVLVNTERYPGMCSNTGAGSCGDITD